MTTNSFRHFSLIFTFILLVIFALAGCGRSDTTPGSSSEKSEFSAETSEAPSGNAIENAGDSAENSKDSSEQTKENQSGESYIQPNGSTIQDRILTPEGFTRIENTNSDFASFIRNYPLLPDGSDILLYDGTPKGNQAQHVAVFDMAVIEDTDVQQCADSVMRMYAEYFLAANQPEKIKFHFVNGFLCDYVSYRNGNRIQVNGNDVNWVNSASYDDSYETFEKYLKVTFAYSSTISMEKESHAIEPADIQIGDILLKAGSPGHVMLVVDVCENESGQKAFLLAQGFMPAQQFHIVKNPLHEDNPWYYVDEISYPLHTPAYSFDEGSLRRPEYLTQ